MTDDEGGVRYAWLLPPVVRKSIRFTASLPNEDEKENMLGGADGNNGVLVPYCGGIPPSPTQRSHFLCLM